MLSGRQLILRYNSDQKHPIPKELSPEKIHLRIYFPLIYLKMDNSQLRYGFILTNILSYQGLGLSCNEGFERKTRMEGIANAFRRVLTSLSNRRMPPTLLQS